MKNLLTIILSILYIGLFAQPTALQKSAPLSPAPPSSVAISEDRLVRIDNALQHAIKEGAIPGGVALIARKGKIVYHKAFGTADYGSNRKYATNDIFRIASQTKAIAATAVMILWEEGKFRLDDPISKYIPEFKNPQVLKTFRYADTTYTTEPADKEITIRHLLTHTSGIGYGVIDGDERMKMLYAKEGIREIASPEGMTTKENTLKIAKMPLHFHPGEKFYYSMGLDVLGYFVEVISGKRFDVFLRERLFDPLEMTDTYFYLPKEKHSRLIPVQTKTNGKWVNLPKDPISDPDYPTTAPPTLFSGGAGLSSTAKDYATFLQMYLNGGELNGNRILSPTTIKTIMANQIGDFWGDGGKYYGLAFGVVNDKGVAEGGIGSKGTFDWGGYFNTQYFADPEEQIIGVLLKQTRGGGGDPTGWQFRQLVFQTIE